MCCETARVVEVEAELERWGASAIALHDATLGRSEPSLDGNWARTQLTALLPSQTDFSKLKFVFKNLNCEDIHAQLLEKSSWVQKLNQPAPHLIIEPFVIGDFRSSVETQQTQIQLSAGLAFGTGEHDTTAMCLEWLATKSLLHKHVLDLGCGSGILAIAAMKLGAKSATAIDNDQEALNVAETNAANNDVAIAFESQLDLESQFYIVIANIYADTLIQYAEEITRVLNPRGLLALSGILESQQELVKQAYANVQFESPNVRNAWVLLAGTRTDAS